RQSVIPPLRGGFIVSDAGGAAGLLFPQPHVDTAQGHGLLDRMCGAGWRLVVDAAHAGPINPDTAARAPALGVSVLVLADAVAVGDAHGLRFSERDGVLAAWFARHGAVAALVRPDHYVFGTVAAAAEADRLLEQLEHGLRAGSLARGDDKS